MVSSFRFQISETRSLKPEACDLQQKIISTNQSPKSPALKAVLHLLQQCKSCTTAPATYQCLMNLQRF